MPFGPFEEQPFRNATDTVVAALESFGESEPKSLLIIHTNDSGNVVVTANCGKVMGLGLVETVKAMILAGEV
jgi:hypothetical protein